MEIVQKITIYDILGYVFPGSILVLVYFFRFAPDTLSSNKDNGYFVALILILGYAIGMVLSEISRLVICLIKKVYNLLDSQGTKIINFWKKNKANKLDEVDSIGIENVVQALKNVGIINENDKLSKEDIKQYFKYMYADIQTDSNYSRIHNYASSALVCKNMAASFFCSALILTIKNSSDCNLLQIWIVSTICIIMLILRYRMNENRKNTYTLDWFVGKYIKPIDDDKANECDENNKELKEKTDKDAWNKHYVVCLHKIEKS